MAIIKRINRIKNLSTFDDYSHSAALPEFRRYNLLYGFNGSGKTTLSRLLRYVELGVRPNNWPPEAQFSIELDDGVILTHDSSFAALHNRICVFNADFIEDNLDWKDGKASPIFYIGKEQRDLGAKLRDKENALQSRQSEALRATQFAHAQEQKFANFKRDAARVIAAELNLGRSYNATHLENDYASRTPEDADILSDEVREQLKITVGLPAPPPKLDIVVIPQGQLSELSKSIGNLISKTVGVLTLDELKKHPSVLGWIRYGVDYHSSHALKECLFCGNELSPTRLEELRAAIDDRFDRLIAELRNLRGEVEAYRERWRRMAAPTSVEELLYPELKKGFAEARAKLLEAVAKIDKVLTALIEILDNKIAETNTSFSLPEELASSELEQLDNAVESAAKSVNKIISEHNRQRDEFDRKKIEAREKLKRHLLAEAYPGYVEAKQASVKATDEASGLHEQVNLLRDEVNKLRMQIREHGQAAETLTKGIAAYLGHNDLEVKVVEGEEGYRIYRRGRLVKGCLSEGEKTAIALVYFLSRLTAENRRLQDLIVVIDDPVSSLDSRALNYAVNLLRKSVSSAEQVFILTHNMAFLNEVKKWLRRKVDEGKAAWLMVDCWQDGAGVRRSRLVELPSLLASHESEYHYLFKLMYDFANSVDADHPYLYLMPNALRKILELFLTFKFPDIKGNIGQLVEKAEAAGADKIDPVRLKAVERLVQAESHGDNLDDLISMSPMTIEETRDAAKALLHVMECLDKLHVSGMKEMCA